MKIISKFLFLLLLIFTVSGCGSFFGSDEALGIASIETEDLDDGSIKLTINYTDEELDPVVITIPKGDEGARGNGIKDIKADPGDEVTTIVVTYTDTSMPSLEFPIPHGTEIEQLLIVDKDGYEIKTDEEGNDYRVDEEGNSIEEEGQFFEGTRYLKVIYTETESPESDVKKSSIFELPEGRQGQEGNGIESIIAGKLLEDGTIEENKLNDDGSVTLRVKYTLNETPQDIVIPPAKGILTINKIDTATSYGLEIVYTTLKEDGTNESARYEFAKPTVTQWLSGTKHDKYIGNIGDYFYDEDDNQIYIKKPLENDPVGYWHLIADFGKDTVPCVITFNANGGYIWEAIDSGNPKTETRISVESGTYLYRVVDGEKQNNIPQVYHPDGYKFLGWYTDSVLTPTSAQFTELTIVNTNITLYAIWQETE